MKKLIICAAIIFAAIGTLSAQETKSREVEVFTRVERNITPDEILISITINEQDNKGKVSLQKQEEAMIKTLKGIGIDVEEALKVNDIASSLKT
ncbi:MAG: SIMPL domain-containing protein, partial [Bacteroidales bacterium]|nr:SIMPL domain-containing protein [Bacteroidales bacterium]